MGSLSAALERWASIEPEKVFIIEAESGESITYKQFLSAVYEMRRYLGAQPQRIALTLPPGITTAVTWINVLTGGHTLIPLSPQATGQEKARMGQRYQPDVLLVEQAEDARGFACPAATVLNRWDSEGLIRQAPAPGSMLAKEGQVFLHTSGSTGEPKGVALQERQIAWTAQHIRTSHRLSPEDRGLSVLPFFHVNAPVVSLCASLIAGSSVVIARRFSRRNFWRWVEDYQVTWPSIVPTILAILLGTERPSFLPGTVRFVRTASAPLPASQMLAFEAKFGLPVVETYGLTEAASQVTANLVPSGVRKPGSVGLPTGVALRICTPLTDNSNQPLTDVEPGATGEICVFGPSVIKSYIGDVDEEAFQEGWFRTGDLGYLDEDEYVYITGRIREVIIRGGENIAPREVEEVLLTHPAVREVAVVGRPDAIYGEVVVAYVVPQNPTETDIAQQLHQYTSQQLSPAKVPVDFIIENALPHTNSGKIARHELRERESQRG